MSAQASQPPLPVRPDGSPLRVLVVDDEPSLADLLATVLRMDGWDVRTAGTVRRRSGRPATSARMSLCWT